MPPSPRFCYKGDRWREERGVHNSALVIESSTFGGEGCIIAHTPRKNPSLPLSLSRGWPPRDDFSMRSLARVGRGGGGEERKEKEEEEEEEEEVDVGAAFDN